MKRILSFADSCDVTDRYQDGYSVFPLGRFFDMWREGPARRRKFPMSSPLSPRGGRMYAATIRVCPLRERSQAMAAIIFWRQ